jgi:DNA invertase Pin-like site-specific DNA recombinase
MAAGTVAIYARQSQDKAGNELAVGRQLALCRRYAAERGWVVSAEYVDNDRSATSRAPRPQFEALLASRPERVLVWHQDRLLRVTRDLERVIALGVDVHAVEAGPLDLSTPTGRAVARTVTAWSTYEVEQKSARQRAANDQRAEAGLPYRAGRAFGFEGDGVTVRESEAEELRAAAEGVLRGRTMSSLVADLNARGVTTATGRAWRTTTLKAALLSPRNAGLRRHRGVVVGAAAWPAIFDEATAAGLRAVLTDPARCQRGPSRRYLLSGLMECGKCGEPVVGAYVKGKGPTYRCPRLHLSRQARRVDEFVEALVVARLSRDDARDLFTRPEAGEVVAALEAERAGLRARMDGLAEAFAAGAIDGQALAAGSRRLRDELARVDEALAGAVSDPTLAEVAGADDVAAAVAGLPLDSRRQVVAALLRWPLLPVGRRLGAGEPPVVGVEWR